MLRRILPILVALLVLLAAIYVVFSPQTNTPPALSAQSAPATSTQPKIATISTRPAQVAPNPPDPNALPPLSIRTANTLLLNPFPNDPALSPTLVALDLHQADDYLAIAALADAAKIQIALPTLPRLRINRPLIELHLTNHPLFDALFQLEAQSGVSDRFTNDTFTFASVGGGGRTIPGEWCIAGPFAFLVNSIAHTAVLRPDNAPANAPPDRVLLQLVSRAEPKLRAVEFPTLVDLSEALDEKGHSLLPAPLPPPATNARGPIPIRGGRPVLGPSPNFSISLLYPPRDPGRLIKSLKGAGQFLLMGQTLPVIFDDPTHVNATKTTAGLAVSATKLTWNQPAQSFEFILTIHRITTMPADWDMLTHAIIFTHPHLQLDPGLSTLATMNSASTTNDVTTLHFTLRLQLPGSNTLPEAPAVARMTLDLPTAPQIITVPLEFHDLPLP